MKKVLAFDIGASSGRGILGTYENGKITLTEIHRFPNDPVRVNGHFYWDILRLFHEIKTGISKCIHMADIASIGIDTWGVDYGFIGKNGALIGNPYHYRDERTAGVAERVEKILGENFIYEETGIQIMDINTVYQLFSGEKPKNAKLLFIPDLLSYFLTGEMKNERTNLSTSQLLNPVTNKLSTVILNKLGIDKNLFCPVIEAGEVYGVLKKDVADELNIGQIPVIAVASHDTASAVAAVPFDGDGVFISCGTWSLLGTELVQPLINRVSAKLGFSNESGYGGSITFLKNINGLFAEQECRKIWGKNGGEISFDVLNKQTEEAKHFEAYVDLDDPLFLSPPDMTAAIRDYCVKTGQTPPVSKGEYLITILKSLAEKYRQKTEELETLAGKNFNVIHMVGGGIKNELLCQLTADAAKKTVIAGPVEATAIGNILVQFISCGEIKNLREGREIIKNSFEVKIYKPK